jgi:hypothetical protein
MNYNIFDIFGRKRFGRFSLGAEVPIVQGSLGTSTTTSLDYTAYAVATDVPNPGKDEAVVTDAQILAAVTAIVAPAE